MKYCNFGFMCQIFVYIYSRKVCLNFNLTETEPKQSPRAKIPFFSLHFFNTNKLPNEKLLFTAIYYHFIHTFGRWYLLKIFFAIIRSCQACRLSYHKEKSQYNSGLTAHSFFAFLLYWLDCFIFFWLVVLIWLG